MSGLGGLPALFTRGRIRRAWAGATALLVLVSLLHAQTREAMYLHVRCAEHGQLVHVHAIAVASSNRSASTSCLAVQAPRQQLDHDHCLVIGAKHCAHGAIAAPASAMRVDLAPPASIEPAEYVARATFRIAPKTSPPA